MSALSEFEVEEVGKKVAELEKIDGLMDSGWMDRFPGIETGLVGRMQEIMAELGKLNDELQKEAAASEPPAPEVVEEVK